MKKIGGKAGRGTPLFNDTWSCRDREELRNLWDEADEQERILMLQDRIKDLKGRIYFYSVSPRTGRTTKDNEVIVEALQEQLQWAQKDHDRLADIYLGTGAETLANLSDTAGPSVTDFINFSPRDRPAWGVKTKPGEDFGEPATIPASEAYMIIKEIIKIASKLDQRGLTKEADILDNIIKKYSSDYHEGFGKDEKFDVLKDEQPKYDHSGRPIASEETEEASEFDVESFVLNNFIDINPEYSEDFREIEDLWQSSGDDYGHQLLVEYFDSIVERLDIEGQQSEESFNNVVDALESFADKEEHASNSSAIKDVASFFRQHLIRSHLLKTMQTSSVI